MGTTPVNAMQAMFGSAAPTYLPAAPAVQLPPPTLAVQTEPLPANQQAALALPWNPFDHLQQEARMNSWYMATVTASNNAKVQQYNAAWRDWFANFQHAMDLGLQPPAPPTPPVLTKVAPMPAGYWFGAL